MKKDVVKVQNNSEPSDLLENLFEGVIYLTKDGSIVMANLAACTLFGYSKKDIEEKSLLELLWPYNAKSTSKNTISNYPIVGLEYFKGESLQIGRNSRGEKIQFHLKLIAQNFNRKDEYVAFIKEINDSRLLLLESSTSTKLSSIIDIINSGLLITDENHDILFANQEFCNLICNKKDPELITGTNFIRNIAEYANIFASPESFISDFFTKSKKERKEGNAIFLTTEGKDINIRHQRVDAKNSFKGNIYTFQDVTEVLRSSPKSQHQTNLLAGVTSALNMLLTSPPQNIENAVLAALEKVGLACNKDRICIVEIAASTEMDYRLKIRSEWIKNGFSIPIQHHDSEYISFSPSIQPYMSTLSKGNAINESTESLPLEVQSICQQLGIKSSIFLPILLEKNLWGILSVFSSESEMQATTNDVAILNSFAQSLGGAISHSELANALQSKTEKLLELNASLEEATKQAKKMSEEAAYAAKAKTQFLATMSHEIRTPMNGVIGMTSLLQRTKLDEEQREYLATIRNSGDALLTIINDILDFSKIESGNMELELNPFDLRLCIEDVLDLFWLSASQKNIDISYWVSPDIKRKFTGDVSRIRQILVNLVGNAIKFTHQGSISIEVRMLEHAKTGFPLTLEFKVADTGIGIPKDKSHKLFKAFNQVDSTITRKYGGTGLGLAISSKLVELMGGTIKVDSIENVGSTFTFTITLEMTGVADITAIGTKLSEISIFPHIINEHNRFVIRNFLEALSISSAARSYDKSIVITDDPTYHVEGVRAILLNPTHEKIESNKFIAQLYLPLKLSNFVNTLKKTLLSNDIADYENQILEDKSKLHEQYPIQILVAEDNTINQKLMRKTLSYYGYTVDIVANGLEVLEALERQTYDLIFMDIQMPEMDGLEATRRIVEKYKENRPKIIAMTASALGADRENCLKTGMDDYTSKPIKIEVVEKMIVKWNPKAKRFNY